MSSSSIQTQQQQQPTQVVPLTLDANTADSIFKANKKISDYVHQIANEPSVGMYHVQEHIRKTIPKNVAIKKEIRELDTHIEELMYNVDDSSATIQSIAEIQTFNHIHDLLLSSIDKVSKLVNNKSLQFINSSHLKSTASSTFSSYKSFDQLSTGSGGSSSSITTPSITPNSSVQYDNTTLNNNNDNNNNFTTNNNNNINDSESSDNFNEIPINNTIQSTPETYDYLSTSKKKSSKSKKSTSSSLNSSSSTVSSSSSSSNKKKDKDVLQPKQF
ncbi:hypothetical protein PPL_04056 [Heterostelium album PN500]|uniref:Uncharacterized protein n=1 Tax=Heterostelium pallidum (strain ATCC 26659 / Pp 5 / PN500) TaxID=670386 RepID=D3B5W8_HETP5|nr:hypothetical protein PPL_04056 [Heterostelium album PN500]EFA83266.1 hypothetical protein PPL_04056 [Heterostelium album PN500]|eukprot:XP_020435383.1 hypothetical protein PPL_04056 [Heterostelium album PN500]